MLITETILSRALVFSVLNSFDYWYRLYAASWLEVKENVNNVYKLENQDYGDIIILSFNGNCGKLSQKYNTTKQHTMA